MGEFILGSVFDSAGRWPGTADAHGQCGWIVDGVQVPRPLPAGVDSSPKGSCWTETRSYHAIGEFPLVLSSAFTALARAFPGQLRELFTCVSDSAYRHHVARHPPHVCPPAPGHGVAAVYVSGSRVQWAVLGPCAVLWRPAGPYTGERRGGTHLKLAGWRGVSDLRVERSAQRERLAYLDAVASQEATASAHHEAYFRAMHHYRNTVGGYWLLGAGRLQPDRVIVGELPPASEVILMSSALYRRFGLYAARGTSGGCEFSDANDFLNALRADSVRALLRARYDPSPVSEDPGDGGVAGAYSVLVAPAAC